MPATSQLRERAQAWWGLTTKAVDQWLDAPPGRQARPAFVLGCQRSGTTMLIDVLRRSPSIWVWPEKSEIPYHDYRLRSPATVELVNRLTPAEVAVYKPLCDSHLADRLLDLHAGSRALWAVRHWADVARSAVAKWGPHQREVIEAIARGRADTVGWRGERLPPELVEQLRDLVHDGVDDLTGAALFWFMRNSFYWSLGLEADERVRVVRYEALVRHPELVFPEVFGHLGATYAPAWHADVTARGDGG
ncbi:MAG TPA: hypothetical protein PKA64_20385, partial [Myxococcota bacterium]|nr:hypothetical protein [Myxococcota bacterium]